jgi:hypothetical protein
VEEPPSTTVAVARRNPEPRQERRDPTPEPPPAEPAAPAMGSVRVEASGGWSEVYEGGRSLGRTPLTVQLTAGTHILRLLPFGNEPASTHLIRVHPGTEVGVRVAIRGAEESPDEPEPSPFE